MILEFSPLLMPFSFAVLIVMLKWKIYFVSWLDSFLMLMNFPVGQIKNLC
jgi:hypothetical protein